MLKTPEVLYKDPVTSVIAEVGGRSDEIKVLEEGVLEIGHFSLEGVVTDRYNRPLSYEMQYPQFKGFDPVSYGVCDVPAQFLEKYRELLEKDPRTFVVGFTHIAKDPENKGKGGGWRWHKWGPYIGVGEPQCEHLDDEDGFEAGVYVYSIVQTAGPILKVDFKSGQLVEEKSDGETS